MAFKVGDYALCIRGIDPSIPPSPCGKPWPAKDSVYKVEEIAPGETNPSSQYLTFEGLRYTPNQAFSEHCFKRVKKTTDFTDVMCPKTVWVPVD